MLKTRALISRTLGDRPYLHSVLKFLDLSIRNGIHAFPPKSQDVLTHQVYKYKEIQSFRGSKASLANVILTTNQGVFLTSHQNGVITQVLKGKYYGITKYRQYWILARSNNYTPSNSVNDKSRRQSDICVVKLSESKVEEYSILLWGIPGEIHQIDIFMGRLYIPHTGTNQILSIPLSRLFKNGRPIRIPKTIMACESRALNIPSPSHLNSIYYSEQTEVIYVVAHNSTAHTGRKSNILELKEGIDGLQARYTGAHSAHNVALLNKKIIYCDSNNSRLVIGNECVFKTDKFLRGLSITDEFLYVGGSDIDFTGRKRNSSNCYTYVLKHDGELVASHEFIGLGNLMEIRQLNGVDYAMSSTSG